MTSTDSAGPLLVSIIVPTKNSGRTIDCCLASAAAQSDVNIEVIVVDNDSIDKTREIAAQHQCVLLSQGPERSAQRNHGARHANGSYLFFVDSDMVLDPQVVHECVAAARRGAGAVIIPEVSFGEGFWARCKRLERSCYVGDDDIEAARFYERELFERLGGFDEGVSGPEDWDLSQRAAASGAPVVRTRSFIRHDEGRLKLGESMRKKYRYGKSMLAYRTTHRGAARRQFRLMRPAFVRHRRALAAEPLTAVGMLAMKTLEFGAGAAGAASTLARRPRQHVAPSSGTDDTSRTLKLLIGDHGRIKSIEFQEGARAFHARVFEDNLWGAVKDNLVLGEYERSGIRLADMRGVVVDAGAHVGLFSLLASAHVETVVALEAHPRNFMLLAENVARNEVSNVQPHQCAVWRTNGAVEFLEGDRTSSGSILGGRGERFVVPSETLDSIVATTGPVDLLKLDIEGAEFDVLEHTTDATLRQISAVVAELHLEGQEQRLAPMLARLRRTGFTVAVRRPPIAYWRETMLALARNRRRLRRERRLRLTVIALYSLVALIRTARRAGSKADERNELMFLYATREPTASEAPTGILDARAHLA